MNKNATRWIVSLGSGLFALLLMSGYWNRREKKWMDQVETMSVWVMKKDIAAGQRLRADNLTLRRIPRIYAEPGVFSSSGKEIVFASSSTIKARIGLKEGEQVTRSKIIDQDTKLGLSWTLPANQTAMSLKVPRDEAVAGFIQPGDWICVFGTLEKPGVVLKQVRVLAVQDQMAESDQEDSLKGHFIPDSSVLLTLSVRRDEAGLLSRALEHGHISIALLPAIDEGDSSL